MDFFDGTKLYQKAIEKRVKRDYISLVHEGVFLHFARRYGNDRWFDHDLFFALIIPYQLKQRLRQVIPILATTKTGRRIYQIQLIASALVALFVGILQMAVYGIIWHLKDYRYFGDVRVGESHQILTGAISFLWNLYVTLYGSDLIICNRKYCDH